MTLAWLRAHPDVAAAVAAAAAQAPESYETRIATSADGPVALWQGDAGYDICDVTVAGARHRLCMRANGWVYERD